MVSYEHKVKNIYLWSPLWVAHIPSISEFEDLVDIIRTLSIYTWSTLKTKFRMPRVWYRQYTNASLDRQWSFGRYWTSDAYNSTTARYVQFDNDNISTSNSTSCATANSVRLFLDGYVEPNDTRTIESWSLWGAWIFYNANMWIISATNWNDKNITMYDKNVGATEVFDWISQTEANMWKMFQWWNYYWFPSIWTISKTSWTRINTTWYWGNNPYSSDTFITWYDNRSNPANGNLRTDSKEEYFVLS